MITRILGIDTLRSLKSKYDNVAFAIEKDFDQFQSWKSFRFCFPAQLYVQVCTGIPWFLFSWKVFLTTFQVSDLSNDDKNFSYWPPALWARSGWKNLPSEFLILSLCTYIPATKTSAAESLQNLNAPAIYFTKYAQQKRRRNELCLSADLSANTIFYPHRYGFFSTGFRLGFANGKANIRHVLGQGVHLLHTQDVEGWG